MNRPIEGRVDAQEADLMVLHLLMAALIKQTPDIQRLIADFSEMSEDNAVRTMNSEMPESLFQRFLELRESAVQSAVCSGHVRRPSQALRGFLSRPERRFRAGMPNPHRGEVPRR